MKPEDRFDSLFEFYAAEHGLEALALKAQARAASGLDPGHASPAGRYGLFALEPAALDDHGYGERDPLDADVATAVAAAAIRRALDTLQVPGEERRPGTEGYRRALAAQVWGLPNVLRHARGARSPVELPEDAGNFARAVERAYRELWEGRA